MTVGAVNTTGGRERGDEARNEGILAGCFNRVIRSVDRIELDALVGLHNLTLHSGWTSSNTVAVTPEAEFVFIHDRIQDRTGGINAFNAGQRPGCEGRHGRRRFGGVWIMAISALDVARRINRILHRVMNPGGV